MVIARRHDSKDPYASLEWDDELPQESAQKWNDYCTRLPDLHSISIPRWDDRELNDTTYQIHGFADASTRAYAAAVYLRVTNSKSEHKVTLLAAETKVAPIITISVPRLELCAAGITLLAKLIEYIQTAVHLTTCSVYASTDSAVVLAWLQQHPSGWPTFVANRVATIQHRLPNVS